jgi:hypothetical protein
MADDLTAALHSKRPRARQSIGGMASLAFVVSGVVLGLPHQPAESAVSAITVTHVAGPGAGACLPVMFAATADVTLTSDSFSVSIYASAPICDAVTAVIYSMPVDDRWPWPQRKVESKTFSIQPGVTTVVFARGCEPVQFDVVTGDTPSSIDPVTGPMHGPLLFWFPWTGFQDAAGPCDPASSTTSSTSTSTSSTSTSSTSTSTSSTSSTTSTALSPTTTAVVPAVTTTVPIAPTEVTVATATSVPSSSTMDVRPAVLAATTTVVTASSTVPGVGVTRGLAFTGGSSGARLALALGLLVAGAVLAVPFGSAHRRR